MALAIWVLIARADWLLSNRRRWRVLENPAKTEGGDIPQSVQDWSIESRNQTKCSRYGRLLSPMVRT